MKHNLIILTAALFLVSSCTSMKKLGYLNNLPKPNSEETFTMDIPDYKLQLRDILYITAKAMTPDGMITDYLSSGSSGSTQQDASEGYLSGYVVNQEGNITIPVVGTIKIGGLTLEETRKLIQSFVDKVFNNSTVECKLRSFKVTVIGEVKSPGIILNYSNYLTVLEAIGRVGGIGDYGDRHNILVIRPVDRETKTFSLNLQDKKILTSGAYFLLPNDVVIVQPTRQKIFNLNTPTIAFLMSSISATISTTLLLIYLIK
jgi:polysaccharide biosynthesis/export protein